MPSPFFLDESSKRFINLVYLFKESAFSLIDLLGFILVSISFISALTFMIYFLLLTLWFVLLSLVAVGMWDFASWTRD